MLHFTPKAWRDTNDGVFFSIRMPDSLQEGLVLSDSATCYLFVRAIDLALRRRSIIYTAVLFQRSGQSNYANEMLHMHWLLSDGVSDPVLQRAILSNSLVQ